MLAKLHSGKFRGDFKLSTYKIVTTGTGTKQAILSAITCAYYLRTTLQNNYDTHFF